MKERRWFELDEFERQPGRGRPKKLTSGVAHRSRPALASRFPLHVAMRVIERVGSLKESECYAALREAFAEGRERFGFRLTHFGVKGDQIHLIVEANDSEALSRGMQGLTIRMARALNRALGRRGRVFADRFHSRILRTPAEVQSAIDFVIYNRLADAKGEAGKPAPYSSARPGDQGELPLTSSPRTALLRDLDR